MYQIAYIGRWETLPETAAAICDHDTPKLETLLQGGLDLDVPIQLSEYIKLMPLEIAVFRNDVPMIHFLLEHGADPGLAEEQPLLLTAARCCGPEVVALFAEQAAKLSSKQKERAFQEVRWGKRPENIKVLEQAGITVDKFGGEAFRAAVSDGQAELAKLLLEKGADINYHKPDMVFPYASTPVTEAARSNNFSMVRWLVEQGANITLVDKYGDRPYYEILTKQFIHRFNSTEKELLDELNMERSVFYDRKREAIFLLSLCLFGYAVPELQEELEMPRLYPD